MNIYFKNQKKKFESLLKSLKGKPTSLYDHKTLTEKIATLTIETETKLSEMPIAFFWAYKIFPKYIMTSLCQWIIEKRPMVVGDTILQQVFIPPFKFFSIKMIMGVRITSITTTPEKVCFCYETLDGHIEQGTSEFTIEQLSGGRIVFTIHTLSKPRKLFTTALTPISIAYQRFCTITALSFVKKQFKDIMAKSNSNLY